ncbi:biotin/lipoyl-binding protein [uncultured Thiodictyon sp.]|uniref:efflux RND transporter periplasmic adaptor subunit n=1 Tax=uncultured Thiodictyon sp. TaxID=1846217 RepID=UPI0025D166E4|nr:biotin/lipoyl-binding protein [uncultured Thiodictyon sp.]
MTDLALNWSVLVGLQQRALEAADANELAFLIANETWHLVPYRQAVVFFNDTFGRPRLKVVSALVSAIESTPFTLWVGQVCGALGAPTADPAAARVLTARDLPAPLREGWAEWWPPYALYQPLMTAAGRRLGVVIYARDESWGEADLSVLQLLHQQYAHCLAAFKRSRPTLAERWQALRGRSWWLGLLGLILVGAMFIPVRVSVLAPAEIIALKAEVVAAPADGVVQHFHALPNQAVTQGQLLFSLDDTTLRNRLDIAREALEVALTDALTAQQKAFDNAQSKAELASLQGLVREKQAELEYVNELLSRVDVVAAHDGVFIYGDPNDWIGKPVVTGERIAQLAEPGDLGVLVWVPVDDAIALQAGAAMRVYLQVSPLQPLTAELIQTSYQAILSPQGVASYRIRGRLESKTPVHIGLRGVAKVYGDPQPLIYLIMRRPLGVLRQRIGL